MNQKYRAGFVAVIGAPNAGKSTLTNALVGEKVSIVSPKPQTTRQRITGLVNDENKNAQIVFVDAPGVLESGANLNSFLIEEAKDVIKNADVLMPVLAVDQGASYVEKMLTLVRAQQKPVLVVVSKADLIHSVEPPPVIAALLQAEQPFVLISTLKKEAETRDKILERLVPLLPESEAPLFEDDLYTTQSLRQMAAELIRERCFEALRQEVPYGLAILVRNFKENQGPTVKIQAEIIVDKDNHKGIVIGSGGQTLKAIGTSARQAIEALIGRKVHLELHVVVKKGWMKNKRMMKELGYVVPE